MRGNPHRDRCQSGGHQIRNNAFLFQHHRQRARPKGGGKLFGHRWHLLDERIELSKFRNMHNQRIKFGALFGLENSGHRLWIQCIGSKAVNGFGRKRDQTPVSQNRRSVLDIGAD